VRAAYRIITVAVGVAAAAAAVGGRGPPVGEGPVGLGFKD